MLGDGDEGEGLVARDLGVGVDRRKVDDVAAVLEALDGVAAGSGDRVARVEQEHVATRAADQRVAAGAARHVGARGPLVDERVVAGPAEQVAALVAALADERVVAARAEGGAAVGDAAQDLDAVVARAAVERLAVGDGLADDLVVAGTAVDGDLHDLVLPVVVGGLDGDHVVAALGEHQAVVAGRSVVVVAVGEGHGRHGRLLVRLGPGRGRPRGTSRPVGGSRQGHTVPGALAALRIRPQNAERDGPYFTRGPSAPPRPRWSA